MLNNDMWFRDEETNRTWWKESDNVGEMIFSFDKKKEYNLFLDYPNNLSESELQIFNKEHPEWKEFFSDRIEKSS